MQPRLTEMLVRTKFWFNSTNMNKFTVNTEQVRSEEAKPGEDKEDKGAGGDQHEVVEL